MSDYRVSNAAKSDLQGIWLYIAQDDPVVADRFVRSLSTRFPLLASMPELGRKRDELSPRLRSFPVKNYIIFYRRMASGVEIARILHGARDLPTLFE